MSAKLKFHPLADIFPLMEGAEFDELVADIKANGQHEPVVLYDGMILDGRNRYRACLAAGVGPDFINGDGWIDDPAALVISANIHRRHLSAEEKRDLIAKLIKARPEKSNRQIAKAAGVSHPHVAKVRGELEKSGDVETVTTSIDTKGRKQPTKKTAKAKAPVADASVITEGSADDPESSAVAMKARFEAIEDGTDDGKAPRKRPAAEPPISQEELRRFAYKLIQLDIELARELIRIISAREPCAAGGYAGTTYNRLISLMDELETGIGIEERGRLNVEPLVGKTAARCPTSRAARRG